MIVRKKDYFYIGIIMILLTTIIFTLYNNKSSYYHYSKAAEEFYTLYHSIGKDLANNKAQSDSYLYMTKIDDKIISRLNSLIKEVEKNVSKDDYEYFIDMKARLTAINVFIQNRGIEWIDIDSGRRMDFGRYIDMIITDYVASNGIYHRKHW